MTKEKIQEKLKAIGIETNNCYPKTSFMKGDIAYVGLYPREMNEDFYFFNNFSKKIYKWNYTEDIEKYELNKFMNGYKYEIPMTECELIWEDKPLEEKPDKEYKAMTLREYACIQLRVPDSGNPWLDTLIKQAPPLKMEKNKKGKKYQNVGAL